MFDRMANLLTDPRKRKEYNLAEIIMAAVVMFLFKEGSRNSFNTDRRQETFIKNYERIFGLCMPHMDTVEDVLRMVQPDELEKLKASLVSGLIEKKVLHKFKFLSKRFIVAIDGTGLYSYDKKHCEQCLHKTSSNGTTSYFHHVLEAKLITRNGMAISLCTEWIANDKENQFDKQDCEHNAFKRLAVKLKKLFPRLPICICADGLYPNQHFFAICEQNNWDFIVTFKDGNLPSLQEEIQLLLPLVKSATERIITTKNTRTIQTYQWINDLQYKNTSLHWIECKEQTFTINTASKKTDLVNASRFVQITNLSITSNTANEISDGGRLRWKIENEGFNTQKNGGYNIEHKYSRVSFQALQNYYQCLQIAHCINQLVEKSTTIAALLKDKLSVNYLWKKMVLTFLLWVELEDKECSVIKEQHGQIRLTG